MHFRCLALSEVIDGADAVGLRIVLTAEGVVLRIAVLGRYVPARRDTFGHAAVYLDRRIGCRPTIIGVVVTRKAHQKFGIRGESAELRREGKPRTDGDAIQAFSALTDEAALDVGRDQQSAEYVWTIDQYTRRCAE